MCIYNICLRCFIHNVRFISLLNWQVLFPFLDMSTAVLKKLDDLKISSRAVYMDIAVVSPDTILLTNGDEFKVKLFDIKKGHAVSEMTLLGYPRGLCLIRSNQAVVAVKGKKVQFFNLESRNYLTKGFVLDVNHDPFSIARINDTSFVISYHYYPWLEVLTTDGKVSHQFDKDGKTQYFKFPNHITSSTDNYVYVSDFVTNTITKLDFSLQLLVTFCSPLLTSPRGIISVSSDQLLVCSTLGCWDKHLIVMLNTRTGEWSTLLENQERSSTLGFCPEQKKLYAAKYPTDRFNVYELS